jgi:hypothetical protein
MFEGKRFTRPVKIPEEELTKAPWNSRSTAALK